MKNKTNCELVGKKLKDKMSPSDVAKKLNVHLHSVYRWINEGELVAEKKGKFRYITKENYKKFIDSRY